MNVRPSTAAIVAIVSLGLGFAAGSLPKNSVGSPQIKNGQVTSADLKNGGVTSTDVKDGSLSETYLAASTLPSETTHASTSNGFVNCAPSGWCYASNSGSGTVVASFDSPPPNASGWTSTGAIDLPVASQVLFSADPVVWFFGTSNLDVICTLKDGTTNLLSTGWIRSDGNQAKVVSLSGLVSMTAGTHAVTLVCRSNGVENAAVEIADISAVIVPSA